MGKRRASVTKEEPQNAGRYDLSVPPEVLKEKQRQTSPVARITVSNTKNSSEQITDRSRTIAIAGRLSYQSKASPDGPFARRASDNAQTPCKQGNPKFRGF
ncbi:unnamed protein product [Caenorhabditis auriculariae]|uniref:Uncharacterized protein n=1 Tax=Caenorhabditis auriculariae TaxID=2777116 RepID=A0A8S1HT21_9PELO|nr:unnamed protein product [Caenorhabditis auriculariae]